MKDCKSWLKKYLSKYGESPADAIITSAGLQGYSKKELRQARIELGVVSSSVTYWGLPNDRVAD